MNSAAVSASDSASTGCPPPREHDRACNCDEEQDACQLEREQIVLEQRLSDRAYCVQLLKLLFVEEDTTVPLPRLLPGLYAVPSTGAAGELPAGYLTTR